MSGTGAHLRAGAHSGSAIRRALLGWLGAWPQDHVLRVAPSARRTVSTAGQAPDVLAGVVGDARHGHAAVISVPPLAFIDVRSAVDACTRARRLTDLDELLVRLPASVGRPGAAVSTTPLRWTVNPDPSGRRLPATWADGVLVDPAGGAAVRRAPLGSAAVALSLVVPNGPAPERAGALLARAAADALDAGRLPVLLGTDDPTTATAGDAAGFPDHGWSRLALSSSSTDTLTHKEFS